MILNIALGIFLAVFILPLIVVIIKMVYELAKVLGVVLGVVFILALVAGLLFGEAENLKLAGGIIFFVFYCLAIGYLTKDLPFLEKLSDGVDRLSFRSGDWINFIKERIRNHARRGFIVGYCSFFPALVYVANSSDKKSLILVIFLSVTLAIFVFRLIKKEITFKESSSEINQVNSQIELATNLSQKALVLIKEKKFDSLVINLRNALEKKLIPKVGDPPGELEVKRYLVNDLDLFVKKSGMDYWSRFDMCIGFSRSSFPELCVCIDVHIGVISVENFHYSLEFQKNMDKLSSFLNAVIERDRLNEIEREKKAKIKLAEEESGKFKGL